jgi:aminomethyltransferase
MVTKKTPFYHKHMESGGKLVDFAVWEMPIQYLPCIITEHLTTRKTAGLFDVSHMGRFSICGTDAAAFLDYALTNRFGLGYHGHLRLLPSLTAGGR